MYIRRKVFSVLADEMGEERLYSVNDTLFEGYEVDELDERMYAHVVDGQLGSTYQPGGKGKVARKDYRDFWSGVTNEEGEILKKAPKAKKVIDGVIIDKNTGKPVEVIKGASKREQAAIRKSQKAGRKAYEKALKAEKEAFAKSGVADMKKMLRKNAFEAGKKSAGLKDAFKNASKLGKAGMVLVPAAAIGGAAVLGRASNND